MFGFGLVLSEVSPRPWSHSEAPGSSPGCCRQGPLPTGARCSWGGRVGVISFLWLQNGPQAGRVRVRVGRTDPLLCLHPPSPGSTLPRGRRGASRGQGDLHPSPSSGGQAEGSMTTLSPANKQATSRPDPLLCCRCGALSAGEASRGTGGGIRPFSTLSPRGTPRGSVCLPRLQGLYRAPTPY